MLSRRAGTGRGPGVAPARARVVWRAPRSLRAARDLGTECIRHWRTLPCRPRRCDCSRGQPRSRRGLQTPPHAAQDGGNTQLGAPRQQSTLAACPAGCEEGRRARGAREAAEARLRRRRRGGGRRIFRLTKAGQMHTAALQQCGQRAARRRRLRGVQALRECTTTHPRRFWAAAWLHARRPLRLDTPPVPAAHHAGAGPVLHPAAQAQRSAAGARRTGPHAAPSRHEAAQTPRPSCRREGLSSAARGMRGRRSRSSRVSLSRRRGVCGTSANAERAGGEWSALLPCEAHRQAALAIAAHRGGRDRVPLRARWARPQATGTPSSDTAGWLATEPRPRPLRASFFIFTPLPRPDRKKGPLSQLRPLLPRSPVACT